MSDSPPVLDITSLTVAYENEDVWQTAVRDLDLRIEAGQTYGLVGESGSGKTTVALAVMRYLGSSGRIVSGSILFNGLDMVALKEEELRGVWGKEIALVPQNPQSALNPSMRVGEQIAEILRRHAGLDRREAMARAEELLCMVRVPDPQRVLHSYTHQISGGMQQRVLIAMALSTEPALLILDEPTTGLDVTTQAAILDLFRELTAERQTAVLYVTHNLGVVSALCDRVAVLYAGELVEDARVGELFHFPYHPYTEGLLDSIPQIGQKKTEAILHAIPGQIPPLGERLEVCVFAPRCALAIEECSTQRPDLETAASDHQVRCYRWREISRGEITTHQSAPDLIPVQSPGDGETVLLTEDLKVYYGLRRSLTEMLRRQPGRVVKAVDGVDLTLGKARTLGIVGESGSGKTTLARAVVGLAEKTDGEIQLLDMQLPAGLSSRTLDTLRHVQYVFQNPDDALNPHMTIGQTLQRPFISLLGMSSKEAAGQVSEMLRIVRLPESYADRYPNQLSGGEKQRVAIARAFATSPDLLIADEPVSALDVSVQASILNLLNDLQNETRNSLILISHDLAVVGYLADQVAVMYLGQIMEISDAARIFEAPMHPYTEALLAAIPTIDPDSAVSHQEPLQGDVPSQIDPPSGCPFHPRCPRDLGDICRTEEPVWQENEFGDRIYCHIPLGELQSVQQMLKEA
jgi:peptide/nickel transport system ATP-binding protein